MQGVRDLGGASGHFHPSDNPEISGFFDLVLRSGLRSHWPMSSANYGHDVCVDLGVCEGLWIRRGVAGYARLRHGWSQLRGLASGRAEHLPRDNQGFSPIKSTA